MSQAKQQASASPTRRRFFTGAATVGAAAAAVATLPLPSPSPSDTSALAPAPEGGGGYSLSDHVKRYYQTTRV